MQDLFSGDRPVSNITQNPTHDFFIKLSGQVGNDTRNGEHVGVVPIIKWSHNFCFIFCERPWPLGLGSRSSTIRAEQVCPLRIILVSKMNWNVGFNIFSPPPPPPAFNVFYCYCHDHPIPLTFNILSVFKISSNINHLAPGKFDFHTGCILWRLLYTSVWFPALWRPKFIPYCK